MDKKKSRTPNFHFKKSALKSEWGGRGGGRISPLPLLGYCCFYVLKGTSQYVNKCLRYDSNFVFIYFSLHYDICLIPSQGSLIGWLTYSFGCTAISCTIHYLKLSISRILSFKSFFFHIGNFHPCVRKGCRLT